MVVHEILGRLYVWCTKNELPEVIQRISEYTAIFVVTSINDMSDLVREVAEQFQLRDDHTGKFIILRRAGFAIEKAQEFLDTMSSELFSSLQARAEEHLPFIPFRSYLDRTAYARSGKARLILPD